MAKRFGYLLLSLLAMIIMSGTKADAMINDEREDKQNLLIMLLSYPEYITDVERGNDGYIYIVMSDGTKIIYDDKKEKNSEEVFYKPDIQDGLGIKYPLEKITAVYDKDPGRLRNYALLNAVYGKNKGEIEKNLINVSTMYGNILFNKQNKAAVMLKKSLDQIYEEAKKNNNIGQYVYPISGTFNYRVIQDTGMLSPHAYALAIDLNRNDADYWKWVDEEKGSKRIAEYPAEIVRIFEDNGFVWGGKWKHFDILHFEYKPEIILKAKYFGDKDRSGNWYEGAPNDEDTMQKIEKIEKVFS